MFIKSIEDITIRIIIAIVVFVLFTFIFNILIGSICSVLIAIMKGETDQIKWQFIGIIMIIIGLILVIFYGDAWEMGIPIINAKMQEIYNKIGIEPEYSLMLFGQIIAGVGYLIPFILLPGIDFLYDFYKNIKES